jgi:hypothetical protein
MWRTLAIVLLIPSFIAAQTEQDQPVPQAPLEESATRLSEPATVRSYTFYDAIRRGHSEKIAVQLTVSGFVTMPQLPVEGIVPVKLEFQPSANFAFGKFHYTKPRFRRKVSSQAKPILVPYMPTICFMVKADDRAALGGRMLRGKIIFQVIRMDSSLGPVEQRDALIPITVVEHNAKVKRDEWPYDHMPAKFFAFIPLLIPVALAYYPVCAILGQEKCPN